MKTLRFFVFTFFLTIFVGLPFSFAQGVDTSGHHVKLIYFIPSDRTPQPDIDTKIDALIKETQQFFADEMERHGYGRKTFRFEADENGNAIVHHIKSPDDDKHYHNWVGDTSGTIRDYFGDDFDLDKYVFLVLLEVSTEVLGADWAGYCGFWGGTAWVPASGYCFNVAVVGHEIAHGFGLTHNFRDDSYIMSYGANPNVLSACAAEWLDVSPYFNPDKVITPNRNTDIKLLSSTFDATPPYALRLRFEITDPDRLHQAQLVTTGERNFSQYVYCKSLREAHEIVEFAITDNVNSVSIYVIDRDGNYIQEGFDLGDIDAPGSEVVVIPDANLAAAIRNKLEYPPEKQITSFDMARLSYLNAYSRGITDLTGLEHAVAIEYLNINDNQIQDLTPILALPELRKMHISQNPITDLTQVSELTQLTRLFAGGNQLRDITPLAKLTQLTELDLRSNQISDLTPLSNLTQMDTLFLGYNQISDIRPLANLTQLTWLQLNKNQIRDITPLKNMVHLTSLNLQYNQISDIRPLKRLVELRSLYIDNNHLIDDITGLEDMTQLKSLQLSSPLITDITPLRRLTNLEELYMADNQVSDITPLANLRKLKSLQMSKNQIADITPLANLTQLNELGASYNQITDITPLAKLTKLQDLFLAKNHIRNTRPLMGLINLKILSVWGNPITDRQPLLTLKRRNPDVEIYHIRGGVPLPVTLSSVKAERTADGAIINWTTESEVDNAGFNILRSRTKSGVFEKINAKLIQGAGTTGERSTYTWTDTTAKPNTVYYYQIEDVSHAGVHQTLATTRLRGLISAKGKLVTQWASFKTGR